jgi:hypothetical protein
MIDFGDTVRRIRERRFEETSVRGGGKLVAAN